jgi:transposase
MSKSVKRKHSADFKAKVALEAIRERKTLIELSQEFEIHPTQIKRWKQLVLDSLPLAFDAEGKSVTATPDPAAAKMESELFEQIGRLKMENEWLKKKYAGHEL